MDDTGSRSTYARKVDERLYEWFMHLFGDVIEVSFSIEEMIGIYRVNNNIQNFKAFYDPTTGKKSWKKVKPVFLGGVSKAI